MRRVIVVGPAQQARALQYVSEISPDPNKPTEVVIRPHRKDKTAEQRNYWHMLIGMIEQATGEPFGRVKTTIKFDVLSADMDTDLEGRLYVKEVSSEKQKRDRYSRLIDYTLQWAAEKYGINLPAPRWQ